MLIFTISPGRSGSNNMQVTPFLVWSVLQSMALIAYLLFPPYRMPLSALIIALILLFVRGILNIRSQFFHTCYFRLSKKSNKIAITFDDGPDPTLTIDILNILKKHNYTATFFVIGIKAEKYFDIVKQCFDAGHTIACHDLTHSNFSNFRITSPLIHDISKAQLIIKDIIGKKPLLYRPPVGLMNPHVPGALKKLGMQCIGWSKSASDAGNRRLKQIKKIHTLAKPGAVVLLHDCLPEPSYKEEILRQIELLCLSIKEKKITAVSIGAMFDIEAYI